MNHKVADRWSPDQIKIRSAFFQPMEISQTFTSGDFSEGGHHGPRALASGAREKKNFSVRVIAATRRRRRHRYFGALGC